ncbi:hypothetical protein MKW98_031787 [Papaver atlanticum]|uniref:Fe2OG dioxygenase domain-containing protein n=1 Tax=Papaver atlanticum TaxID=357466 RepID=A0AAD4ST55_9MAGN|nr:hypothetical protein MKW98_031787 [Papaver atlanticum]
MKTPKPLTLGCFLSVPSVQELAKQSLAEVPARYIRTDQDSLSTNLSSVSLIHETFEKITVTRAQHWRLGIGETSLCLKRLGFLSVKSEIQGFFNLPMDEKNKFWQEEGDFEGFGQAFVHSEDQKLDWGDKFFIRTLPQHMRKLWLFPNLPIPLSLTLIKSMEKALQIKTNVMAEWFEDVKQSMRMNYYPPCPQSDHVIGLTTHSDPGGLTVVLQLNEVDGLQIKKEETWVPIKPLPNAFVVNIGDILEIMTNGIYRSVEHRATINSSKGRLSIGPIHGLITTEKPVLFRTVGYKDYVKEFLSRNLDGKSFLDSMRVGADDEDNNTS